MATFNVVRTRSGDQLHTQYTDDGYISCHTSCGARVAIKLKGTIKIVPKLLCKKCFSCNPLEYPKSWNDVQFTCE